jgi:hypothetical protein
VFPYWLLFAVFAAGAVQYHPLPGRAAQGGPIFYAMAAGAALMIGLRYQVGGDWSEYVEILENITQQSFWAGVRLQDPGYAALNWLVGRAGIGVWAVNLVCGIIFTWGLARFARRQPNPWLVFVVAIPYLIIVVAMGYTRQGVAIGFVLAGLAVFERSSTFRFALYLILGAAFHKSAIIILPLVALTGSRHRFVTPVLLVLTGLLVYYLFVQASVDKLMSNYVQAEYSSQGAAIRVAMNLPPAFLFLLFRKRFGLPERQEKLWRNFAYASLVALAMLMFSSSSTAVDRLALYLIPLQMFVLGRLPAAFSGRSRSNLMALGVVIAYSALIQFVWLNYADNAASWLPYQLYPVGGDTA